MDSPFEPMEDDTPGVASTEKPANGLTMPAHAMRLAVSAVVVHVRLARCSARARLVVVDGGHAQCDSCAPKRNEEAHDALSARAMLIEPNCHCRGAPLMSRFLVYDSSLSLVRTRMSPPKNASRASTCDAMPGRSRRVGQPRTLLLQLAHAHTTRTRRAHDAARTCRLGV
jgi:hypothetical protein